MRFSANFFEGSASTQRVGEAEIWPLLSGQNQELDREPHLYFGFVHPKRPLSKRQGNSAFLSGLQKLYRAYSPLAAIASVFLFASSRAPAQVPHEHHPPRSAEEYIRVLDNPERDNWQKPHDVVMALDLKPDAVIADIGAGTGYFARRFARHAGKVYAVDIDEKLLKKAAEGAPANLATVLAAPDDPKLPDAGVDTIFFCDVLHHIENRPAYYAKLAKALKPGGRIVIIDFYKKKLPVGPPEGMKLSETEVRGELAAAGFRETRNLEILPYQYFLFFEAAK